MTSAPTSASPISPPGAPAPMGRFRKFCKEANFQSLYAIFTLAVVPGLTILLIYFTQVAPYSNGFIGDLRFYGVAAPVLAAGACCVVAGILTLTLRTQRMVKACGIFVLLTAATYFGAMTYIEKTFPMDPFSIVYLLVPVMAVVLWPRAEAHGSPGPAVLEVHFAKAGDVSYTQFGLLMLFAWLFVFDFCFVLMEGVLGNVLSLRVINELGASSSLWGIMIGTVPTALGFVLWPLISVKSDRHRGPRGRRIPFLMYATPFVCGLLALMGFGNDIGVWLHASVVPQLAAWLGSPALAAASQNTIIIWTFLIMNFMFFIANSFLSTVFYYLFNDVVPPGHFVKFMGYMRVVEGLVFIVYNGFIFQYSNKSGPLDISLGFWSYSTAEIWYPKLILVGAAVFYLTAGMIIYFKIREPSYPPPPPLAKGQGFLEKTYTTLKTLVTECFSHRFYALIFLWMTLEGLAVVTGTYKTPMRVSLGMSMEILGQFSAASGSIGLILTFLTANFGDRFKPLPLMVVAAVLTVLTAPIGLLYLIPGLPANWYLGIEITYNLTHMPIALISGLATGPLLMSLFPRDRYGQFSAAGSLIRNTLCGMLAAAFAGWLMDKLKALHGGGEYWLRYAFTWQILFQVLILIVLYLMYREWTKLGGSKGYTPPPVRRIDAD